MTSSLADTNPKRPSTGTVGRRITLNANIFAISSNLSNLNAFQYHVKISQKNRKSGAFEEADLPVSVSRPLWKFIEGQVREKIGNDSIFLAYDGKKTCYSAADLCEMGESVEVDVLFDRNADDHKDVTKNVAGRGDLFKIDMKRVASVDMRALEDFVKGKAAEPEALHSITCLTTFLHHYPATVYTPVGSNFFTPSDAANLGGGLQVWRGYHQSIRALMAGHLGVNIDIAASVFLKGGISLIDYVLEVTGARNISEFEGPRKDRLIRDLKGVMVKTTHRGDMKQRFKIKSVSTLPAKDVTFEKDGKTISVLDYYKEEYNVTIKYPYLPLIYRNTHTGYPMEFLEIAPAQKYQKKLSGNQVSDMIRATVQKPEERLKKLTNAVDKILKSNEDPYLKSIGLKISPDMMKVNARILPSPQVLFARDKSANGSSGVWNLRGFELCSTPTLSSCAFVFFTRTGQRDCERIVDDLMSKWKRSGMNISVKAGKIPIRSANPSAPGAVLSALQGAFTDATRTFESRCQLLVCIVDKEPKSLYQEIKRITLTEAGVLSQVLQIRNLDRQVKDQYAANVAMKVNTKLGGATNYVNSLPVFDRPTMVVGADVTHANPGSLAPSVAAIVTSVDKYASRYNTFLRAQGPREEVISEMESVVGQGLDRFKEAVGIFPERIVVFRDGVSSGQFSSIRTTEVGGIKKALKSRGIEDEKCKLTYIIVQKRHHIRLFPVGRGETDRSGNCCPGTVVDTEITHPYEYNFILQSHAGIQGTSRPTIYHVIYDEIKIQPDVLQQFCYNLCFLSQRATRSISIVAPSYRAHIAATYGRMFLSGEGSDTQSNYSGSTDTPAKLVNVTEYITKTMYYM